MSGEDFFPNVDTGMIRLHVRVPVGTRLEESSRILDGVERTIRGLIPADEFELMTDHIGLPVYWALLFYQTDSLGPQDADLQIQLKKKHHPTEGYIKQIRSAVHSQFPGSDYLPAGGRYNQSSTQFRFVGADRRADCRHAISIQTMARAGTQGGN